MMTLLTAALNNSTIVLENHVLNFSSHDILRLSGPSLSQTIPWKFSLRSWYLFFSHYMTEIFKLSSFYRVFYFPRFIHSSQYRFIWHHEMVRILILYTHISSALSFFLGRLCQCWQWLYSVEVSKKRNNEGFWLWCLGTSFDILIKVCHAFSFLHLISWELLISYRSQIRNLETLSTGLSL